jgi:hypothetical protein
VEDTALKYPLLVGGFQHEGLSYVIPALHAENQKINRLIPREA